MTNVLTTVQEKIPYTIYSGDTATWKITDLNTDYSNSAYTLTYYFRLESTGASFTVNATADNDDYLITLSASTTASITAGKYHFIAYVTRSSDSARVTVDRGQVEVKPNLASSSADPRTHAKIMLDKIESLLEGKADKDVSSYSIQGRSLNKMSVSELLEWRNYYKAEYNRELNKMRNENGDGSGSTIKVSFGNTATLGYYDHHKNRRYRTGN